MKLHAAAILSFILLSGCAVQPVPKDIVPDEQTAIGIGQKACRERAGNKFFAQETLSGWQAQLTGDRWKVWWGPYYALSAYMEIFVAKRDGKTTDCVVMVS